MVNSLFISCNGPDVIETLGFLESIDPKIKRCKLFNISGTAGILGFMKALCIPFSEMYSLLEPLHIEKIHYGSDVFEKNCKDTLCEIEDWMDNVFEKSIFDDTVTLKEIYEKTNIYMNFICSDGRIINKNPKNDDTLKDAVLACLCCYGVFRRYKNYSPVNILTTFPYNMRKKIDSSNMVIVTKNKLLTANTDIMKKFSKYLTK